jgi:hypothetical protein
MESAISPTKTHFGLAENGKRPSISSPPEHSMQNRRLHVKVSNDVGVSGIL